MAALSPDTEVFRGLEEGLWRQETRTDREWLDGVLAPDFTEFCRFGHEYDRNHILSAPVQDIEVEAAGNGLWKVTATVVNNKLIPTHLRADVERHISRPNHIMIEGSGFDVLTGMYSDSRFFEYPREQKRHPGTVEVPRIGSMGVVYVQWLIRGDKPEAVTISSVKGGTHTLEIN